EEKHENNADDRIDAGDFRPPEAS
ncbi:MAG: hypothetical protein QOC99_1622, partial [Acidobacteriota bacterium]|nr:hypothetical protein [Acidobacteriota bacterium]